ncbi:hypothetical protein FRB99_005062 [Tulasnella sp. 403]|nr:hypothetical protein FRB99_005062 [Tulasnella sp. 403]
MYNHFVEKVEQPDGSATWELRPLWQRAAGVALVIVAGGCFGVGMLVTRNRCVRLVELREAGKKVYFENAAGKTWMVPKDDCVLVPNKSDKWMDMAVKGERGRFKLHLRGAEFELEVRVHEDGVFRIRADQVGGLRKRYDEAASWALIREPLLVNDAAKIEWSKGQDTISGVYLGRTIQIQYNPFKITLIQNGGEEIVLNGQGLFHLEHFRQKQTEPSQSQSAAENAEPTPDGAEQIVMQAPEAEKRVKASAWFEGEEEDGYWEETFKTWTDSKPKGIVTASPFVSHCPESLSLDVTFPRSSYVYGIPQHAAPLALPPTTGPDAFFDDPYRLWNLDVFEYEASSTMSLYGSIPLLHAHSEHSTLGLFNAAASETWVDVSHPSEKSTLTHWISESGILDVFLLPGPTPADVFAQYARLTGTPVLPAQWALAYHQCRWNYISSEDIRGVQKKFDEEDMPVDVLWLDIEYSEDHKYFIWNEKQFPDPVDMINDVAAIGRKASRQTPSDIHNQTARALIARETPAKRPFVLSRSFYAGSQRHGAIWTGDNMGTWEHMAVGIPMVLSNSIAGMSFVGADVGGFFGNPPPEMLVRWYQVGAFAPFFRAHAHIDTKRREPYLLDEPYKSIVRKILRLRYSLLPVWYTAFRETSVTGMPVLRPQYVMFPKDPAGFALDNQYYLGSSGLLVYYDYFDYTTYHGGRHGATVVVPAPLERFPLLIRGGSIIPTRERPRRSSPLMKFDPFTLTIALDDNGNARGELYLDDGVSYSHETGKLVWREFKAETAGGAVKITSADLAQAKPTEVVDSTDLAGVYKPSNPFASSMSNVKVEKVVVLGLKSKPKAVKASGVEVEWNWVDGTKGKSSGSPTPTPRRRDRQEPKELVFKPLPDTSLRVLKTPVQQVRREGWDPIPFPFDLFSKKDTPSFIRTHDEGSFEGQAPSPLPLSLPPPVFSSSPQYEEASEDEDDQDDEDDTEWQTKYLPSMFPPNQRRKSLSLQEIASMPNLWVIHWDLDNIEWIALEEPGTSSSVRSVGLDKF